MTYARENFIMGGGKVLNGQERANVVANMINKSLAWPEGRGSNLNKYNKNHSCLKLFYKAFKWETTRQ